MQDVIIFGHTEFSEQVAFYCRKERAFNVLGYAINEKYMSSGGGQIYAFEHLKEFFPAGNFQILLTVGYKEMNENRKRVFEILQAQGYHLASFISSRAIVDSDEVGCGTIILPGAMVGPFVSLGNCCVLYSQAVLAHHDKVGDFCFFAPGVAIAGNVRIGEGCFLGANCTVKNGTCLGKRVLVGAGACLSHDATDGEVIVPTRSITLDRSSIDMSL